MMNRYGLSTIAILSIRLLTVTFQHSATPSGSTAPESDDATKSSAQFTRLHTAATSCACQTISLEAFHAICKYVLSCICMLLLAFRVHRRKLQARAVGSTIKGEADPQALRNALNAWKEGMPLSRQSIVIEANACHAIMKKNAHRRKCATALWQWSLTEET